MDDFKQGMRDGIPIAMGYVPVSFTFGLMAVSVGMTWWQALLISVTNLTSAGQFAGLDIMAAGGAYMEMALTEFIINLRYALMSLSLSQKLDSSMTLAHRFAISYGITDEIFGVASSRNSEVGRRYLYGLITVPFLGWQAGTLFGALLGGVLPQMVSDALGIAIYGMFLAIIIPQARQDRACLKVILLAVILSCGFHWIPVLQKISSGFVIIICAVAASALGAWLYPLENTKEENE